MGRHRRDLQIKIEIKIMIGPWVEVYQIIIGDIKCQTRAGAGRWVNEVSAG